MSNPSVMEDVSHVIKSAHTKRRCPCCGNFFYQGPGQYPENASPRPFCSRRCQLIDLNAWLDADYRIEAEFISESVDDSE